MGFTSCRADPDVWYRKSKQHDGSYYYEYLCSYVDDVLAQLDRVKEVMDELRGMFTLKDGSVEEPTLYLEADIKKWRIDDVEDPERTRWAMSSDS